MRARGRCRASSGRRLGPAQAANGLLTEQGKPRLPAGGKKIPAALSGAVGRPPSASVCTCCPSGLSCSRRGASSFRGGEVGGAGCGELEWWLRGFLAFPDPCWFSGCAAPLGPGGLCRPAHVIVKLGLRVRFPGYGAPLSPEAE